MVPQRKKDPIEFKVDEFIRDGVTAEALGKLSPAFDKDGTVTAGNASGINDGAAAVMLMTVQKAESLGPQRLSFLDCHEHHSGSAIVNT